MLDHQPKYIWYIPSWADILISVDFLQRLLQLNNCFFHVRKEAKEAQLIILRVGVKIRLYYVYAQLFIPICFKEK